MFQSDLFPADEQLPSMRLAYAIGTRVAALLASGRHLTRTDISGLFAEETGVLDWGGAWTIDDYNSAVEIGALLWLRESSRIDLATNVHEAEARFDWLDAALPPRHVRSEAQVELQQFSTPPMLAWLMARAAAVCAHDTLLEPSAGNGALALWGCLQNASLLLNEIDPARRDGLASHDALTVKRSLVGGEQRLELTGFSPDRLDWYKGKGCFTEIIRYRTRLFVPVSNASSVLPALAA